MSLPTRGILPALKTPQVLQPFWALVLWLGDPLAATFNLNPVSWINPLVGILSTESHI